METLAPQNNDATRRYFRSMLNGRCCRCGQDLRGHQYQVFAMAVANPDCIDAVSEFFRLARTRDWESLSRYQHFDALSNVALASALRCPEGELTVLYVRDPFELYENKSLEGWDALSEVDAREWTLFLTQSKWINL